MVESRKGVGEATVSTPVNLDALIGAVRGGEFRMKGECEGE